MKFVVSCADELGVMDTTPPTNSNTQPITQSEHSQSPTDKIAISATELIKLIESGQGTDVNRLVNQVLQDRQAA